MNETQIYEKACRGSMMDNITLLKDKLMTLHWGLIRFRKIDMLQRLKVSLLSIKAQKTTEEYSLKRHWDNALIQKTAIFWYR